MNKVKTKQTVYIEQKNETSYEVSFFYAIVKGFRIMKKIIAIANKTTDHCKYTKYKEQEALL